MAIIQDTRTHVVGELYDTERSYVESLQILVEVSVKQKFSIIRKRAFEKKIRSCTITSRCFSSSLRYL